MRSWSVVTASVFSLTLLTFAASDAKAAPISFEGNLDVVELDDGGAVYSSVSIGTLFTGVIDDGTAEGEVTGGGITTMFDCCIAAGALELNNDVTLTADDIALLSMLPPGLPALGVGDTIDLIDLEGDTTTLSGNRIEVGLSFVLDSGAFDSEDPSNYPFDPADLLFTLFFILEEEPTPPGTPDNDIYSAIGLVDTLVLPEEPVDPDPVAVATPAVAWLLGIGLALIVVSSRQRKRPAARGVSDG